MHVNQIIIGQGISGTFLSYFLLKENNSFLVIDRNDINTPSKISAGIINPVTGRRMVRVWKADEAISFAHEAYAEIGSFLGIGAISQKNIIDFFPNAHQRQVFTERIAEGEDFLASYPEQNQFNAFFNYELGCGEIRHSYIAHVDALLAAWRKRLKDAGRLLEEDFQIEDLQIDETGVSYKDFTAQQIIFCDGADGYANPFFKQLPFAPNKGEALIVKIPGLPNQHIYKKASILAPLAAPETFWFGSNYQWSFPHPQPTREFREQAELHLAQWLKIPFEIIGHNAALRPATLERRPFVGFHPHYRNVGILNGMGTKGSSLAPYFAHQLAGNIMHNSEIDPLANINRFQKILSK